MKKKKTPGSSKFGTVPRISHDSSGYYNSKLYAEMSEPAEEGREESGLEQQLPAEVENRILLGSSEQMRELPDNSVHLMVTSPPYNVAKEDDSDLSLPEYLAFLEKVFAETYRVLIHGGRACVNVANLGRKPYIPLSDHISHLMTGLGFKMRGEIIWFKDGAAGRSMAWGSWRSASNPVLRDTHEYVLVFSKGAFERKKGEHESTITRDDFIAWTKSVWRFNPESARKVKHPAPFPVELPYRLIQLYTFKGDVVLDPFMGSGSTALAAMKAERRFVGYDVDPEYIRVSEERIAQYQNEPQTPLP